MNLLFPKLYKTILREDTLNPLLLPFKEKLAAIEQKKMHFLLKNNAYADALGFKSTEPNNADVLIFLVHNSPELALKFIREEAMDFSNCIDQIDDILKAVIEKNDTSLFRELNELETFKSKLKPSMYRLAQKQNNTEMLELLRKAFEFDAILKPEVVTRILADANSNIEMMETNAFQYIRSFPVSDLKSAAILPLIEWLEFSQEFNKKYGADKGQFVRNYPNFIQERKKIEAKIEKAISEIANDFYLSSFTAVSLLMRKLHPNGQTSTSLTPLDARYLTTRYGHLLGLSKNLQLQTEHDVVQLPFEGNEAIESLKYLSDVLNAFVESPSLQDKQEKEYFLQIKEALQNSIKDAETILTDEKTAQNIVDRYHSGKMVTISAKWESGNNESHVVNVTLYGPYLIYTNRGEGKDPLYGSRIFNIKDASKITPEYIRELHFAYPNKEDFNMALGQIIDYGMPVVSFPSKDQEHGSCSLANPKSAIEPMLVLLAHTNASGPNIEGHKSIQEDRNQYLYKDFTRFVREFALDEVIEKAKLAQTPLMQQFYIQLVKNIVLQHHGLGSRSPQKAQEEISRVTKLIENLPSAMQTALAKDQEVLSCIEKINLEQIEAPERKGRVKMVFSKALQASKEPQSLALDESKLDPAAGSKEPESQAKKLKS